MASAAPGLGTSVFTAAGRDDAVLVLSAAHIAAAWVASPSKPHNMVPCRVRVAPSASAKPSTLKVRLVVYGIRFPLVNARTASWEQM